MPLATVAENYALDQLGTNNLLYASLHSAYSSSGSNELTGGPYARQAASWASASGGGKNLSASLTFSVPVSSTVAFVGWWDASTSGTFQGMGAAGSGAMAAFTAAASTDTLTAPGSSYTNGQTVVVWPGVGATLPAGLAAGTVYCVVNVSGATFKLSATSGGSAIDLTGDGAGLIQTCTVDTYPGSGGSYIVSNPGSGALVSLT